MSLDDYCTGLEEILSQGDDLVIDVPKIWDYIAEILGIYIFCYLLNVVIIFSEFHS